MRRLLMLGFGLAAASAAVPAPALAHGLVGRSDLPIPDRFFFYGAAIVLIVSFVGLAVLWPKPRLESGEGWRPLPGGVGRVLASRPVEIVTGTIGVLLLLLVLLSGLAGEQSPTANFAPTFVYVIFWVGLVFVSLVFGDVFRAFNPWRALGRTAGWVGKRFGADSLPPALPYPERLGRWPAAVGIFAFVWLELVAESGDEPRVLAIATLIYSVLTFIGMALYGVSAWVDRGEAFGVYFNLFSRVSMWERRDGQVGLRRPLSGLATLERMPGTVALLAVMIGTVSFDGASSSKLWQDTAPDIQSVFTSLGLGPARSLELTFGVGLVVGVAFAYLLYSLGALGAKSVGQGLTTSGVANAFVHSLVPIALVYAAAHYVSLLVFQGQALLPPKAFLASDPLGNGSDLFGTADNAVDYGVVGAETFWYIQVGLVVAGHVAALTLAHDRALVVYDRAREAVRSQYWMLTVMIAFTLTALWLLRQANKG